MPTTYPKRSFKSDDRAYLVSLALKRVAASINDVEPFMVSVVVVQSGRCFIGLSGSNDRVGVLLQDALSLSKSDPVLKKFVAKAHAVADSTTKLTADHVPIFDWGLRVHRAEFPDDNVATVVSELKDTSLADYFDPETQARRLGAEPVRIGVSSLAVWNADVSRANLTFQAGWLAREVKERDRFKPLARTMGAPDTQNRVVRTAQQPMQDAIDPKLKKAHEATLKKFKIKPNWNCSEPKALLGAAESGEAIDGMTTFWHGKADDDVFGKYKLADLSPLRSQVANAQVGRDQRPMLWCRPCETCAQNEHRVMTCVEIVQAGKKGGGSKIWAEAPTTFGTYPKLVGKQGKVEKQ